MMSKSLPHRREILTTGSLAVIGAITLCVSLVLTDTLLIMSSVLVGVVLIAVGAMYTNYFLTGRAYGTLSPRHPIEIEHMKRLSLRLKTLGARDEKSAVEPEKIREYWWDKHRVNSLVKEGYVGRTDEGRLYLIRGMET